MCLSIDLEHIKLHRHSFFKLNSKIMLFFPHPAVAFLLHTVNETIVMKVRRLPLLLPLTAACAALTNKEASLSTRHDSGEYCGAVVWVRVSGQEAKDGRASACADAWRAGGKKKHLSSVNCTLRAKDTL